MATNSNIEWTEATWNPVTGCTRASAGCDNCYAVTMTKRLEAMGQTEKYGGLVNLGKKHFNGVVKCHPGDLQIPLRRRKPTTYFVNSMSDLFHENVPFEFIDQVFAVMALTPQHTYQVLTKRAARMADYLNQPDLLSSWGEARAGLPYPFDVAAISGDPLPNVWVGVSLESPEVRWRLEHLRQVPAAVRFVSAEPLLAALPGLDLTGIQWLIAGGESGGGARPMSADWVRELRDQCQAQGVKFFFKQWGGANKKRAGRQLDGRTWDEVPAGKEVASV